jgi:hypothetical protein
VINVYERSASSKEYDTNAVYDTKMLEMIDASYICT